MIWCMNSADTSARNKWENKEEKSSARNRRAGILIGRGTPVAEAIRQVGTVEGYLAAQAAWELAKQSGVDMPITEQCYYVCYEGKDPRQAVIDLMERPVGAEDEPLWMK